MNDCPIVQYGYYEGKGVEINNGKSNMVLPIVLALGAAALVLPGTIRLVAWGVLGAIVAFDASN